MDERYTIEQAGGITTIRLHRRLNLEEILAMIDEVASSEISSRRLWDLTHNVKFTADEMRAIAARGRERWPGAARVAYLAADDLSFGLMRMFEVFRQQENYETRVFRDEHTARRWLEEWVEPATAARSEQRAAPASASDRLVADGSLRKIEGEVRARYETELAVAGWFKRAWLGMRIRREVARENAKSPIDILWAKPDQTTDPSDD